MGCIFSFLSALVFDNVDDAKAVSKKIDKQILQELKNEPDEIEILILGAQESGKSTLLKQIRLIHKSDYTLEERLMFKPIVFANTIQSMSIILHAVERLGISLDTEDSEYNAYLFYQLLEEQTSNAYTLVEDVKVTPKLADIITVLWRDKGVQEAFNRSNEYQLSDCASYFLSNTKRISNSGYVPTTEDILHTRVRTCGVVEVKFLIKDMMFRLHDVGGQRSDRRKWLSLFDCVHAVIFCVESTSYNRIKNGVSVILESLQLFSAIVNSKVFIDATMIGFLTKIDIFQELVKKTPITIAFSDYTGSQEYHPSIQYIAKKFKDQKKSGPQAFCHLTCVTDTNNMRFVINAVTDLLIKNFLKDCGIY